MNKLWHPCCWRIGLISSVKINRMGGHFIQRNKNSEKNIIKSHHKNNLLSLNGVEVWMETFTIFLIYMNFSRLRFDLFACFRYQNCIRGIARILFPVRSVKTLSSSTALCIEVCNVDISEIRWVKIKCKKNKVSYLYVF